MIKAGIIGGAGYTAGELIRLLINHPDVDIKVYKIAAVTLAIKINRRNMRDSMVKTDLVFTDETSSG